MSDPDWAYVKVTPPSTEVEIISADGTQILSVVQGDHVVIPAEMIKAGDTVKIRVRSVGAPTVSPWATTTTTTTSTWTYEERPRWWTRVWRRMRRSA